MVTSYPTCKRSKEIFFEYNSSYIKVIILIISFVYIIVIISQVLSGGFVTYDAKFGEDSTLVEDQS